MDEIKVKKSLRFSLLDGFFFNAMLGFVQDYFVPFLLLLNATSKEVGLLSALPNLFSSLIQLKSADITAKLKSRIKFICTFVFLQALTLLPMIFMAFFSYKNSFIFIVLVILFNSLGAFVMPSWGSLMSDLVKEKRGEYFGWRNKVLGPVMIFGSFIAGAILQFFKRFNIFYGFTLIFSFAFLFRLLSWYFLKKMYEEPLEFKKEDYFSFFQFIKRARESNFVKFVFFVAGLNFAVNVASPFFAVFMIRDLKFEYLLYTFITLTATFTVYILSGRWGKISDVVGNVRVLNITSRIISILPLLWVINRNPIFLVFAQIISGLGWSGFNLAASNFIYDATTPQKRPRCISYFNVIIGLASCFGALLGGFMADRLPKIFGYRLLTLFIISSIMRISIVFFMSKKIKEVRETKKINTKDLFLNLFRVKFFKLAIE